MFLTVVVPAGIKVDIMSHSITSSRYPACNSYSILSSDVTHCKRFDECASSDCTPPVKSEDKSRREVCESTYGLESVL